jgi:hypothetical protein
MKLKKSKWVYVDVRGVDGTSLSLPIASGSSIRKWKNGKCWTWGCANDYSVFALNKNGRVELAYCWCASFNINYLYTCYPQYKWAYIRCGRIEIFRNPLED